MPLSFPESLLGLEEVSDSVSAEKDTDLGLALLLAFLYRTI